MNRSELVAEMQFKVKMANNILNNLMKDNTLAYSSYYNEYILPELKSYKFIGTKRKAQVDRLEDSASSNYYTIKTGSLKYSKQDLRDRIRVADRIINNAKEGGMLSRTFIENNVDRLMNKFGFVNKDTLLKVYEIYRNSNYADYIKYEIDQTDYESTISKVGNLIESGVSEDTINEIWNNIEATHSDAYEAVRNFGKELTSTLLRVIRE